jgi:hypothetical protein
MDINLKEVISPLLNPLLRQTISSYFFCESKKKLLRLLRMNMLITVLSQLSKYTIRVIGGYTQLSSKYILI